MNIKYFFAPIVASLLIMVACEENLNELGSSIGSASFTITEDSLIIPSKTVEVDSCYSNTLKQMLGNVSIPDFGTIDSELLTQLIPAVRLDTDSIVSIDSLILHLRYYRSGGYIGDSLAPIQFTVYELEKQLTKDAAYTNINPADYVNLNSTPLAVRSFVASDVEISDDLKSDYYIEVNTSLGTELAQMFYDKYLEDQDIFDNPRSFVEYYPGLYLKTTFGDGTLLKISATSFSMYYTRRNISGADEVTEQDSLYIDADFMAASSLGISVNALKTTTPDYMKIQHEDTSYIKAPLGVEARIELPVEYIINKIESAGDNSILNAVTLKVPTFGAIDNDYDIAPPAYLLLVRESERKDFFRNGELTDGENYFLAAYSDSIYDFGNISGYITNIMDEDEGVDETDNVMLLVPVDVSTDSSTGSVTAISESLTPSLVKIENDSIQVKIVYTTKL